MNRFENASVLLVEDWRKLEGFFLGLTPAKNLADVGFVQQIKNVASVAQ